MTQRQPVEPLPSLLLEPARYFRWLFNVRDRGRPDPLDSAGPLELLRERRHALVRAEFLRTRRRRRSTVMALVLLQGAAVVPPDRGACTACAGGDNGAR